MSKVASKVGNIAKAAINPLGAISSKKKMGGLRDNLRDSTIEQTKNYLNNVKGANKKLVDDVKNETKQYGQNTNATGNRYMDAIQNYSNDYGKSLDNYLNKAAQYTGNAGYQNALNQAQMGAAQMAANAGAVAQGNARSNGMRSGRAHV